MKRDTVFVVVFVTAILVLAVSAAFGIESSAAPPSHSAIAYPAAATSYPAPSGAGIPAQLGPQRAQPFTASDTIPGDGTFRVGIDISPGVYRSHPVPGEVACSWSRVTGPWNFVRVDVPNGLTFAAIQPGDVTFRTQGCAPWQKIAPA